jgi:hypothetical protein
MMNKFGLEVFDDTEALEWEDEVDRNSREYIKWVQQSLNRIMQLRLVDDGIMGPKTRSAIRSFQQRKGLDPSGSVESQTEAAIKTALISLSTNPAQVPSVPAGTTPTPSSPSVPLFPPRPANPLRTDPKLELALKTAIGQIETDRKLRAGTFPIRVTIADVTDPFASFPSAGYLETVTDYIASEAKVAVMYAAYALRDMVRRFAAATGADTGNLFALLNKQMNPLIIRAFNNLIQASIGDRYRVPTYQIAFVARPSSSGLRVDFTPEYDSALEEMIVPSHNAPAATCIHGVGYGYLNGALAAGGFFQPSTRQGLWVAGDYQSTWPYVRILSSNDGPVAQAGTTRDMAKLVSLIMTDRLLDPMSCREMRERLQRSTRGIAPWVTAARVFHPGTITHNKVGIGPLKSGKYVWSEVSVYQSPVGGGRRYVVAWQNFAGHMKGPWPIEDIANIIKAAITAYER